MGKSANILIITFWLTCALATIAAGPCRALEPTEILVVANRNDVSGVGLAKYYMERRNIPESNYVGLSVSVKEHIRGEEYDKNIAIPVRKFLKDTDPLGRMRCIVLIYGMPLHVNRSQPPETLAEMNKLKAERDDLKDQIKKPREADKKPSLQSALDGVKNRIIELERVTQRASVDSEIALVLEENYDLSGWIPNPHFLGYQGRRIAAMPQKTFMVSRLDGPTADMVRKMIDDAITTEEKGLRGTAYFDARWPQPKEEKESGYAFYDQSIHRAARLIREKGTLPVVIDDKPTLFQPRDCPQAALYCGWYSLRKYVDAFQWQPGAVGYHIASAECATLKDPESSVWCKMMIEKGVGATIGPVSEPYVQAFPPPELFFALLVDGRLTLAECYDASNPFLSWKMVLIGDPLYRPFKHQQTAPRSTPPPTPSTNHQAPSTKH